MNRLPDTLVMDNEKATRGLLYTPDLAAALPGLPEAFARVDKTQNENREAYLGNVFASVFSFKHGLGRVTCAAFYNHAATDTKRVSLSFPPFTDCAPNRSNAARLAEFSYKKSANILDTIIAAPNSDRQILQAATHNELEYELRDGRASVAVFSDTPMRVYTLAERRQITSGDFSPIAPVAKKAIQGLQDRMHGPNSETQISEVDLAGASQGATQALAVAAEWASQEDDYQPMTVTAQELIYAQGVADLAKRFKAGWDGKGGQYVPTDEVMFIPEPALMHDLDRHGVEIPALWWRMFAATVIKNANIRGLANFGPTVENMDTLKEKGVAQTVIQSAHSPVSEMATSLIQSRFYPAEVKLIKVESVQGQKRESGHLVDENPAVVSTGRALGIRNR